MQLLPTLPALLHHRLIVVVDTLGILPASFLHQPSQQTLVNISSIPWVPPSPCSSPVQPPMWLALPLLSQCCSQQFLHPASSFLLSTSSADTHDDSHLLQLLSTMVHHPCFSQDLLFASRRRRCLLLLIFTDLVDIRCAQWISMASYIQLVRFFYQPPQQMLMTIPAYSSCFL